jgi:hypothetical protein
MSRRVLVSLAVLTSTAVLGLAPTAYAAGRRQPTPPQNCEDVALVSGQDFNCEGSNG